MTKSETIKQFIEERYTFAYNELSIDEFYRDYTDWCRSVGEEACGIDYFVKLMRNLLSHEGVGVQKIGKALFVSGLRRFVPLPVVRVLVREVSTANPQAETLPQEASVPPFITEITAELPESDESDEPVHEGMTDGYRRYFGDTWHYTGQPYAEPFQWRRVVAVGDIHGDPDPLILAEIIAQEPHIIILGGDILDAQRLGTHPQDEPRKSRSLREELTTTRAALQHLLDNTKAAIVIMRGNHDARAFKRMKEALALAGEDLELLFNDPLRLLIAGLPQTRVQIIDTRFDFVAPNGYREEADSTQYLYRVGEDAIVSHCNFSGKQPGQAVDKLNKEISEHYPRLGWSEPRLLIQMHGHKIAHIERQAGHKVLVEPGMGGRMTTESYKVGYKMVWQPGSLGFVAFDQVERESGVWQTDLGSVQVVRPRRR